MAQATLNGRVTSDGGEPCTVYFEWGLTIEYGQVTPPLAGLRTGDIFFHTLTSLNGGTLYHYRAVLLNSVIVLWGADVTFITPDEPHMMTLIQDEMANFIYSRG